MHELHASDVTDTDLSAFQEFLSTLPEGSELREFLSAMHEILAAGNDVVIRTVRP